MNNLTEILEAVKDSIASLCQENRWTLTKSEDANHLFDILYQQTGSGVAVINYDGDSVHQQVSTSVINKTRFSIAVSSGRDLTAPFDNKISRRDGRKSLLQIIQEVKRKVLSLSLPNGLSDQTAHYESANPMSTPDGQPLDAYKISWWCYTAESPEEAEEYQSSSSSSSSDSSSTSYEGAIYVSGGYAGVEGRYELTGTQEINGQETSIWSKGNYSIVADYSEDKWKWHLKNGNTFYYWTHTGETYLPKPLGLTWNVNAPYYPAPTID